MEIPTPARHYQDIATRVSGLGRRWGYTMHVPGVVPMAPYQYPLYRIDAEREDGKPKRDVIISGGVHGTEPAGVYAVLRFLEESAEKWMDRYRFTAYPCVNPSGFEFATLENFFGVNVNRSFKDDSESQEARVIMKDLARLGRRFLFAMDMHETDPNDPVDGTRDTYLPMAYYMFEDCDDLDRRLGRTIIEVMESERIPVCTRPTIFGDINSGGVVEYPEGCNNTAYAKKVTCQDHLHLYSGHSFTTETPTIWDLDKRADIHILALETALKHAVK